VPKQIVIVSLIVSVVVYVATNVSLAARRAGTYPSYWRDRLNEPITAGAVRLVALGASSVQAIGADRPMDGYVGRIAEYVAARAGRAVHIANVSDGGTTAGISHRQLPNVDPTTTDLVVVADSDDPERRVPPDEYRAYLTTLMRALPADRTVYSDLPRWFEAFRPGVDRAIDRLQRLPSGPESGGATRRQAASAGGKAVVGRR
jgi:hypothetical protein